MPTKAIISTYLLASGFFFIFPNILHKINKFAHPLFQQAISREKILNICHRGSPRIAPENTLESFQQGRKVGDMLQMDICETKDEVLIVHHDLDLKRTCGVGSKINDLLYSQLPSLQGQMQLQFAPQGKTIKCQGQHIPTLQQVFKMFPHITMNIELKTPSANAITNMMKLINKYGRSEITIIGIRGEKAQQIQLYDSNSLTFCSDRQVAKIIISYFLGLLPYISIDGKALQIPLFTEHFYEWKQRQWRNDIKAFTFFTILRCLNYLMIPLVWHLRKRGILTFYWVCNNHEEFSRAIKCGASGIITDEPLLLNKYLRQSVPK